MTSAFADRPQNQIPTPSVPRGECPTLQKPMQTGDGLLARLRPVDNILTLPQLRSLAEAAARFGNGIVEITARGSLQVRGLRPDNVAPFESAVLGSGIDISTGIGVGIETPPLAGLDAMELVDMRPLAGELRRRVAEHLPPLVLAPKLTITLDGDGRFHLGGIAADVKVTAFREAGRIKFLLAVGGARPAREPAAPPSVLPDISPTRGENSRGDDIASQASSELATPPIAAWGNNRASSDSPPLWERWPAGQKGVATRVIAILEQDQVIDEVMDVMEKLVALGPTARAKDLEIPTIDAPQLNFEPSPLVGIFSPPSVLPDISPSRGEISCSEDIAFREAEKLAEDSEISPGDHAAASRSPPLRGRCPAGQRGATPEDAQETSATEDRENVVLGLALAYRQASAEALIAFADAAESLGARDIRLAPGHGLFVTGLTRGKAQNLQQLAATSGFLTEPDDPRRGIALCAGSKGCASAFYDTGALAARLLAHVPDLLDGSIDIHLSGCAKGCAHPAAAPIAFVGARAGYGLVVNGAASGSPATYIAENDIDVALAHLQALVRQSKENGESVRACLARLSAETIAAALQLDRT